jgi:hypothetical protein
VERIALGGSSQGGVYSAVRSTKPITGSGSVAGRQAELWGDEQWQVLKKVIAERNPRVIASTSPAPSPSPTALLGELEE